MPQYLTPGVYIEEIPGQKPIAGVGTATGAFVGIAEKGPVGEPKLITNLTQFREAFGDSTADAYLADAVTQFFIEGGTRCYVVRTAKATPVASSAILADSADAKTLTITALGQGTWGRKIKIEIAYPKKDDTTTFTLTVKFNGEKVETYEKLTMANIKATINEQTKSKYIIVDLTEGGSGQPPKAGEGESAFPLTGGDNGASGLDKDVILGNNGLQKFDPVDDINIVAIPDSVALSDLKDIIIGAYGYCERRKDCFFVADPPLNQDVQAILNFKTGGTALNSSYGAIYYPWLKPLVGNKTLVPPSGAVAGIYAATDIRRGVHKAPAGVIDGNLKSAVGIERLVTNGEQEGLNDNGINVIRSFPAAGITVWGARTLCTKVDPEWKYVNVRRLFLFIEESIEEATQWVVFEPNTRSLWQTVKRDVTAFLTTVWRSGALFGSTAEEAFFVKVDDENNPPEVRDLGRLIIDVGVAPVKPAEFVIFRISQKTLGA